MADKLAESSGAVCALELRMRNLTRRKLELEIRELEFEEQLILAESRRISDGFISMIDDEGESNKIVGWQRRGNNVGLTVCSRVTRFSTYAGSEIRDFLNLTNHTSNQ